MMRWLLFTVLVAALLATAIGVVLMRHESRQLFVALQETEEARDTARVEWSRLQLEQAWLADAGRIERQAREEMDMISPEDIRILVEAP